MYYTKIVVNDKFSVCKTHLFFINTQIENIVV